MRDKTQRAIVTAIFVLLLAALACTCTSPRPTIVAPSAVPQADASAVPPADASAVPTLPSEPTEAIALTNTPVPDVPGPGECSFNAKFVTDVTIPDGTVLSPDATFIKVWRMRNTGTCTWEAGTKLVFSSGDQMGGPPDVPVAAPVAPGAEVDINVSLKAPSTPGTYQGKWQLRNHTGTFFGSAIWVKIVVQGPPTDTPTPLPGPMCTPPSCPAGEVAICPGLCTGGCGMVCATTTPPAPAVPPPLAGVWNALGGAGGTLGSPTDNAAVDRWVADQRFEHGYMYWRNNEGSPANYIYVLYYAGGTDKTQGTWERYEDTWVEGMAELSCAQAIPPNGPRRGFGKVWCDNTSVRLDLGAATEEEQGVNAAFQDFEHGTLLWSSRLHYVYAIFDGGTWKRFNETP